MKIYLAGVKALEYCLKRKDRNVVDFVSSYKPYLLESFYYADSNTANILKKSGDYLLDSGAFTFMSASKKEVDWIKYIESYAKFINDNNVEKFFELDIDYVVGYEKVKEYRSTLESLTQKRVIPVWHKIRGMEEFRRMCDEYEYVAVGSSGKNEDSKWIRKTPIALRQLVKIAHTSGCKIHGLGFSSMKHLDIMGLDSVDSTSWLSASRYGRWYYFDGKKMVGHATPKGKRLSNTYDMEINNFEEWVKFQKYAEGNL